MICALSTILDILEFILPECIIIIYIYNQDYQETLGLYHRFTIFQKKESIIDIYGYIEYNTYRYISLNKLFKTGV